MWRFLTALICMPALISCARQKDPADAILQMKEMSELATVEYTVTKIVKASDEQAWYKVGERRILMSCQASIKAGIDLSQLDATDIRINGSDITLWLPPAKILSLNIRPEDIHTEFEETGFLRSDFTAAERNALMAQGEVQIRNSIPATGILKTAESNAVLFFGNLLRQMGYEKVDVRFGNTPTLSPSLN